MNLNEVAQRSTVSETAVFANETNELEGGVVVLNDLKPTTKTITVEFVGEPGVEDQIKQAQDGIDAGSSIADMTSSAVDKDCIYTNDRYTTITEAMLDDDGQLRNPTWVLE